MGLKHMIKDNAWNETHAKNRKLMEKNGLATYLTNDLGFIKYATTKGINLRKDEITQEFIDEFLTQREATNTPVQNNNSDTEIIDENFAPTETTNTPIQNNKIQEIKEKFGIDLSDKTWFECTIEELRESTFFNDTRRDVNTCYVIIYDKYIELIKESVFIKSDMGGRKIYFENINSIDYDKRGKLHLSNSVMINTKAGERAVQLKFVPEKNYNF